MRASFLMYDDRPNSKEYARERDMDAFWKAVAPKHEPARNWWYLPAVVALLLLGAPWFWTAGEEGPVFAGLPVWVWITLATSFALSCLTAFAALRLWRDDDDPH